ncbi:MAG: protein-L-isoaspartate(D-aspartate) O-methyltransferase [Thermoguttaceae bacterium]|jgi:protein-L-isoaspartate(D-aspartate) O-methyltransferase
MKQNHYIAGALIFILLAWGYAPERLSAQSRQEFDAARNKMVDREIVDAGVKNPRVIEAMRSTPRHEFVTLNERKNAYLDMALPIGEGQTISPPFIVAYMTETIDPQPEDKVLEIGTGSGYQAAVLSPLVREVYTIEIVEPLGRKATKVLERLHYDNVHVKIGDGYQGWPEHAPFDKIIVTCSPENVPPALAEQLKEGGRMVIPMGQRYQQSLYLLKKINGKLETEALKPTLFVPMTGKAESQRKMHPDPSKPAIENGGFEQILGDPPEAAVWHYQRQMKVVSDKEAPEGGRYAVFSNAEPGRGSQALQGFALDGRKVKMLDVSFYIRGNNIRLGQNADDAPTLTIIFYDENRGIAGRGVAGPWTGTFGWRREVKRIEVPPRTREAIVCIGLFGAVGEIAFDDIQLKAATLNPR